MKHIAVTLVAMLAVAACSGTEGMPSGAVGAASAPAPAAPEMLDRTDVERDLTLTLRRATTEPFELGRTAQFQIVLANHSRDRSYPIVLSSDGSDAGWREPHLFYTVEQRTGSEVWQTPPLRPLGRCGVYDVDWTKDVVVLAPGKEVILPWSQFYDQWGLEGAAQVRVVAHYVYGDHARDLSKVPPVLHSMPPYALTSNALELTVDPPITLELTLKGALPRPGERLSPAVDVVALNRGSVPLHFATADTGANLVLEVEGQEADGRTTLYDISTSISVDDAKERIAPGERKNVVGASKSLDYEAIPATFRARRVRAELHLWWYTDKEAGQGDERTARSPWVDVK
jgi:hypothetical protein